MIHFDSSVSQAPPAQRCVTRIQQRTEDVVELEKRYMNPFYEVVLFMGEGWMTEVGIGASSQILWLRVCFATRHPIFRTSGYMAVIRRP
jgi:hypothetical protein